MNEITVISGKGGTGKTTITAALAATGSALVLCDGDVDAADMHLILDPTEKDSYSFEGGYQATINQDKCAACGICSEYCRFDAIMTDENNLFSINPYKCEGCRLCERICPSKAISSSRSNNNHWFVSDTRFGTMVHAQMGPGEENSGKLVTVVRKKASELALLLDEKWILTDGPPGTGCATIASVTGSDAVVVVIEPSLTSLHDVRRVIELVNRFHIPVFAIINKADIEPEITDRIEQYLKDSEVPLLGKIPFDREIVGAMVNGQTIVETAPNSEISGIFRTIWENLTDAMINLPG